MKTKSRITRLYLSRLFLLLAFLIPGGELAAQDPVPVEESENVIVTQDPTPVDENGNPLVVIPEEVDAIQGAPIEAELAIFSSDELEEFVGPIALYPDNLLAIILPASTYPLQIVLAARFLEALENDSSLEPDETWDESVIALLNYPEVIQMMNENIQWTWQLGEAVVTQETEVLTAIGAFREKAVTAGNLESDEYQAVTTNDDVIEITQVEETTVYVPYYVPEEVIVYQPEPVYHYYPTAYPVYYYPYPARYRFRSVFFWGLTTAFGIGWHDHHLRVYHHSYSHHPYYGRHYDSRHRYRRSDIRVFNSYYVDNSYRRGRDRHRDGSYWRPQRNSGARPYNRRNRYNDYPARSVPAAFNANRGNVASGDYGGNAANRGNGANSGIAANRGAGGNRPNRGNGGPNNNRRAAIDPSARNGFAELNAPEANNGLGALSNDRQGNRVTGNNRGSGRGRSDTSAIVGNNSATTAANALTAPNNRPGGRRQNNDRRSRIDRQSGAALGSSDPIGQESREPGSRESSEFTSPQTNQDSTSRGIRRQSSQSDTSALTRPSNTASSPRPERGNRVQTQRGTNRSTDDGRRRRERIERQLRDQSSANSVVQRSTRRATTNSSPARQQSIAPERSRDTRTLSRANTVRNQVNRSRGATITEPSNRQARRAPSRQSSVTTPRARNSAPTSSRQSSVTTPRAQNSAPTSRRQSSVSSSRRQSSAPPSRRAESSRRSEPSRRSQAAPNRRSSAPAASRRAPSSPRQSGSSNRRSDKGRRIR
ncbi:MAG: DUF3300 domain-containing protein [Gammaproteobacteria bacterium]|nr:DUF3300 domain-containing protein [Gammaproteobacteria bacterium]